MKKTGDRRDRPMSRRCARRYSPQRKRQLVVGGDRLTSHSAWTQHRAHADAKLASVVGNNHGVRQQSLMADRAS